MHYTTNNVFTKRIRKVQVLVLIFVYTSGVAFGQSDPSARIKKALYEINFTKNDSLKIVKLSELANFFYNYLNDAHSADSLSEIAINIAETGTHPNLKLLTYNCYLESNDLDLYHQQALQYINKALLLVKLPGNSRMKWRTYHNQVAILLSMHEHKKALEFSNKSMALAINIHDTDLIVKSYLDKAKGYEALNLKLDALGNYLNAKELAEYKGNRDLEIICYSALSNFYYLNSMYEKADEYNQNQICLVRSQQPVDSISLMWAIYDMQLIHSRYNNKMANEQSIFESIDFAIRTRNKKLKIYEFALCRTYYIENDRIDLLYNLYHYRHPVEFNQMLSVNPTLYYRLQAFFKEYENKTDSARFFFKKAEKLVLSESNKIFISTFYYRFGQFLIRQNRKKEAIEKFKTALTIAQQDSNYVKVEYMLKASRQLESLYHDLGDYKTAYAYSKQNKDFADTINFLAVKDQVFMLDLVRKNASLEQEKEKAKHKAELDKQKSETTIKQRKTERNMLAGGLVFLILIAYFIHNNFKNQKQSNVLLIAAKKKSEDLLLNILPYEIAEELKINDSVKAKKFENVTVMFTDFKEFTRVSEQLSAEELVRIIHYYFSEFDRIISKYSIEKIKIIGDSYMCVGGLPVVNETHAFDVVSAALDLQDFMAVEKRSRLNRSEPFFELRIGIHTGPVVAGIVGINKFAYDIWGDTVNTASRLESEGVTNKVNISGNTYELVRHRFSCTYRGRIVAKHKGEIDMYFADFPETAILS